MNNSNIQNLRSALILAHLKAENVKGTDDAGTCNFDSPVLVLPEWTRAEVIEAFNQTTMKPYFEKNGIVEIIGAVEGQGFRRTAMAEAFRNSLVASGFRSYVNYVID